MRAGRIEIPRVNATRTDQAVGANPYHVYLDRLAPGSRPTMRASLRLIARLLARGGITAEDFPWWTLTYRHTVAVRNRLAEDYTPATANKMLAALRGVLKEAWRLELMDAESYQRAATFDRVRGDSLPRGRALSTGEIAALFESCAADVSMTGIRDAALLGVLYGGGLRRSEVVALDLNSWNASERVLAVKRSKGRKSREVPLPSGAAEALDLWIEKRGKKPGPLFLPVLRGGKCSHRRLAGESVREILMARGVKASVGEFSPHDLRRSFVSDLLDREVDLSTVQRLAGHANPRTTTRYDRRGEEAKRRAADRLHVPFRKGRVGS